MATEHGHLPPLQETTIKWPHRNIKGNKLESSISGWQKANRKVWSEVEGEKDIYSPGDVPEGATGDMAANLPGRTLEDSVHQGFLSLNTIDIWSQIIICCKGLSYTLYYAGNTNHVSSPNDKTYLLPWLNVPWLSVVVIHYSCYKYLLNTSCMPGIVLGTAI